MLFHTQSIFLINSYTLPKEIIVYLMPMTILKVWLLSCKKFIYWKFQILPIGWRSAWKSSVWRGCFYKWKSIRSTGGNAKQTSLDNLQGIIHRPEELLKEFDFPSVMLWNVCNQLRSYFQIIKAATVNNINYFDIQVGKRSLKFVHFFLF